MTLLPMTRPAPAPHRGSRHSARRAARLGLAAAAALLWAVAPAQAAPYKVVGPDGRVTYTDVPTSGEPGRDARVTRLGATGANGAGAVANASNAPAEVLAGLPAGLRAVAERFPVLLYTSGDCGSPCAQARQWLRQHGVPYAERTVDNADDTERLQRLTGARTVPALAVGRQVLRGFQDTDWTQTVELAGYAKDNLLPPRWQPSVRSLGVAASAASAASASAPTTPANDASPRGRSAPAADPGVGGSGGGPRIRF